MLSLMELILHSAGSVYIRAIRFAGSAGGHDDVSTMGHGNVKINIRKLRNSRYILMSIETIKQNRYGKTGKRHRITN